MLGSIEHIPLVKKELINDLRFPPGEVLADKNSIIHRVTVLHHATSLGNLDKHKVTIVFEDREGLKRVNTTIWAITDKRIILKYDQVIPINRIHSVVFS